MVGESATARRLLTATPPLPGHLRIYAPERTLKKDDAPGLFTMISTTLEGSMNPKRYPFRPLRGGISALYLAELSEHLFELEEFSDKQERGKWSFTFQYSDHQVTLTHDSQVLVDGVPHSSSISTG